jgi:hypothetical protein
LPWCDDCSKFWNPPELGAGQSCPRCGRPLGASTAATPGKPGAGTGRRAVRPGAAGGRPQVAGASAPGALDDRGTMEHEAAATGEGEAAATPVPVAGAKPKGAPWHFKLLVVGVTVYMVYRIYWLIEWLPKHL